MTKTILISLSVLLLVILGIVSLRSQRDEGGQFYFESEKTETVGETTERAFENAREAGLYEDYEPEKLSFAETGKVLLFFKASWCGECHEIDRDILRHRGEVPANVAILKVDYDNSSELKKKYGVTIQHTFIQVDANGNLIAKWSDAFSLSEILKRIK